MDAARPYAGKVCLIVGASRGIGRDTARLMAARGAQVALASRELAACQQVAREIAEQGGEAEAYQVDSTSADSSAGLVAAVDSRFGRLDMAFNNAGKILGFGMLQDADPAGFDAAMQLNAGGVFHALRAQIPLMVNSGGGSIVINSAASGIRGIATIGLYSAAKSAAIMLAQVAAQEAGPQGVRVNAIAPGYIGTDAWVAKLGDQRDALAQRVPLRRIGDGEEVARTVAWPLSDEASYVNGAVIPVDGGLLAG